jgi:hypothetical protein
LEKQNNNKCQNFISIATMLSVIDIHKLITMGFHIHIGLLSLIQTCYWQSQVDCDGIPHPHRSTIIDTNLLLTITSWLWWDSTSTSVYYHWHIRARIVQYLSSKPWHMQTHADSGFVKEKDGIPFNPISTGLLTCQFKFQKTLMTSC